MDAVCPPCAHPTAGAAGAAETLIGACVKCARKVTATNEGSFGKKSKQIVHKVCVLSCKRVYRLSKDLNWKTWFEGKTPEDQQNWFHEQGNMAIFAICVVFCLFVS